MEACVGVGVWSDGEKSEVCVEWMYEWVSVLLPTTDVWSERVYLCLERMYKSVVYGVSQV